jgi:oligopeptide/dipeptide ABC transporter ATP-binding protein
VPTLTFDRNRPMNAIAGRPPDLDALPAGCAYAPRCPLAVARCKVEDPPLDRLPDGRRVACWVAHDRA